VKQVVVYSQSGCHLCEEAMAAIVALRGEGYEFDLHEVDIESEEILFKRLLERIPVVELDGQVVSELVLDEEALRARLDTVRGARSEQASISGSARSEQSATMESDDRAGDRGA
jgi:glutaredoxin